MIWGSSTVDPRWMATAAKRPWYDAEPIQHVNTIDSKENIEICLNSCPFLDDCHSSSELCPHYNGRKRKSERRSTGEIDKKLLDLFLSGWINRDSICEELGISKDVYYSARKRLIKQGAISRRRT